MRARADARPAPCAAEVLLVEDNPGDVVLTQEALRRAGPAHHVTVARDGEEAMRMLRREPPHADAAFPDLVLLDLNLPRKDGRQVLREMQRDPALAAIPVVVLTGSAGEQERLAAMGVVPAGFCPKPIDLARLTALMAEIGPARDAEAVAPASGAEAQPDLSPDAVRARMLEQEFADFSYRVSHDLAAPMRHAGQFARLLLQDLHGASDLQKAYALRIQQAAMRSQEMLEQLLAFSRVQQKTLCRTVADAGRPMRTALLQLSEQVRDAGARITIPPLGPIEADGDLVETAFRHLLDNALKFRRADAPCIIDVRSRKTPRGRAIRIADNGIGVPVDRQEELFRMFVRLDPDDGRGGVGAGLALCRRIARRHGGDVRFLEQEQGACVEILLPSGEVS